MKNVIQRDLPNTPDEVIDIWLEPHSKRAGFTWPPTADGEWKYVLGGENGLDYLKRLKWSNEEIEITPSMLHKENLEIVVGLFEAYIIGETNIYTAILKSKDRFERCASYIREHGVFPRPVILEESQGRMKILDGNHRILAFLYLHDWLKSDHISCLNVQKSQRVWVARR